VGAARPGEPQPLTAGSFQGLVVEAGSGTRGDIDDGTTRASFRPTSTEDVATVLASLRPFDRTGAGRAIQGVPTA
jgi:hypothetical protein